MEVERNLKTQFRAARSIHQARPDTRFLVACFKDSHQKMAEEMRRKFPGVPIETHVKRTPEIMEASKACISVSGSVSLELLYHAKPTVIIYRVSKAADVIIRPFLTTKYITLVNLLADKMLYPEFATAKCEAAAVSAAMLHWLSDERAYAEVCRDLLALRERVARPGACIRAADRIVGLLKAALRGGAA